MENTYSYRISDLDVCEYAQSSRVHTSIVLKVENESETDEATLTWTPYIGWEFGVMEYDIERNVDGHGWRKIHSTTGTEFVYQNDTVGFDHCFRIRAKEDQGNMSDAYSNVDCGFFVPDLYAYNLITPNGDPSNEYFVIDNVELYPNSRLVITNRWGRIVHDVIGYKNDWRGTDHDNELSAGVYYYVLQLNEPRVVLEQINGIVSILR